MGVIDPLQAITIADMAKAMPGPDGKPLPIYDALRRRTTASSDAPWKSASHPEYHRMNISDTAIVAQKTALYEGVAGTKKVFRQVDEFMARYEDNSLVDSRAKEQYPDILAFRNNQDTAKAKDIAWQFDKAIFTETIGADGKGFNGLYSRLAKLGTTDFLCYSAAGSAARSSIFFCAWGDDTVHLIHPKGSKTFGVETEDKGAVRVLDGFGNPFYAYETWLTMRGGLAVQAPKSIARIANIDLSVVDVWTSAKIMNLVNKVTANMITNGKIYAYMSPNGWSSLNDFIQNKTNIQYKMDDFGKPFVEFAGVTWRVNDGISESETAVS